MKDKKHTVSQIVYWALGLSLNKLTSLINQLIVIEEQKKSEKIN